MQIVKTIHAQLYTNKTENLSNSGKLPKNANLKVDMTKRGCKSS